MKRRHASAPAGRTAATRALGADPTVPLTGEARTKRLGPGPAAREPELVLDRYRLESRLGAGGFGVVWLAWDVRLEREVAVKVVPHEAGPRAPVRAEREALVAAKLNRPGVVRCTSSVETTRRSTSSLSSSAVARCGSSNASASCPTATSGASGSRSATRSTTRTSVV